LSRATASTQPLQLRIEEWRETNLVAQIECQSARMVATTAMLPAVGSPEWRWTVWWTASGVRQSLIVKLPAAQIHGSTRCARMRGQQGCCRFSVNPEGLRRELLPRRWLAPPCARRARTSWWCRPSSANNLSERVLRTVALGRANWGVVGSEAGGRARRCSTASCRGASTSGSIRGVICGKRCRGYSRWARTRQRSS
jgi:hypothetical protein